MIKLDAVKFILEGVHGVAVCFHLLVVTTHIFHDLVNHELRVSPDIEALDVCFDGDSETTEEGLVLLHVVGRGEMQAHSVSHVLPEGRDEEQTRAYPGFHHRPSK
jgi:hypothetical protein